MIMGESYDHLMWGPLLEKAYAKFVGSYEKLAKGGAAMESVRAMTGWPGFVYLPRRYEGIFEEIQTALVQGDIVTCSNHFVRMEKNQKKLGIMTRNVYSILGAIEVTNTVANSTTIRKLIFIRNPWGAEEHYEGLHVAIADLEASELEQIPSSYL